MKIVAEKKHTGASEEKKHNMLQKKKVWLEHENKNIYGNNEANDENANDKHTIATS